MKATTKLTDEQANQAMNIIGAKVRDGCPAGIDHDDAKQQLMMEVLKSAGRYDPARSQWSTFVGTIAARRLIDLNRKQTRHQRFREQVEQVTQERFCEDTSWGDVKAAMNKLSPQQREVFRCRMGLGVPVESVKSLAARRGISRERVKQLMIRATHNIIKVMGGKKSLAA